MKVKEGKLHYMAVRRLTKLANYMRRLPRSANKHFDMAAFFHRDFVLNQSSDFVLPKVITRLDYNECGTTACAAGWACNIREFKKAGLYLQRMPTVTSYASLRLRGSKQTSEFRILSRFFYINLSQVMFLFGGLSADTTPRAWAKRCRKFITRDGVYE